MADGTIYRAFGPNFVNAASADGTFTLKDTIKVDENYDADADHLYVVNTETCEADNELCYYNEQQAKKFGGAGWYDYITLDPFNDVEFSLGTGFQSSFSGNALNFTSSGQVYTEGYSVDCNGMIYAFLVNGAARTITCKEITVGGEYDADADHLYVVNPETCEADNELCYYNEQQAKKFGGAGWYDYITLDPFNDVEIASGDGFQTSLSGNNVVFNFPGSIPAAE